MFAEFKQKRDQKEVISSMDDCFQILKAVTGLQSGKNFPELANFLRIIDPHTGNTMLQTLSQAHQDVFGEDENHYICLFPQHLSKAEICVEARQCELPNIGKDAYGVMINLDTFFDLKISHAEKIGQVVKAFSAAMIAINLAIKNNPQTVATRSQFIKFQ